jgi:hypothetical protein
LGGGFFLFSFFSYFHVVEQCGNWSKQGPA